MKNIALGQYYPARSPLHKLDPRIKLIIAVLYIVAAFLCKNLLGFALLVTTAVLLIVCSRVPIKTVFGSLKMVAFILILTVAINIFLTKEEGTAPLWSFWILEVYTKGLYSALFIALRILCMIIGTCMLLTYTTTPIALTDALERLLSPLRYIKLPVHAAIYPHDHGRSRKDHGSTKGKRRRLYRGEFDQAYQIADPDFDPAFRLGVQTRVRIGYRHDLPLLSWW